MTTFPKLWEALFYWLEFRYNLVQVDNREEPVAEHFAKPLAHYQMRSNGIRIYSRDRGVYQILENVEKEEAPFLQEFTTLLPEEKNSPKCIYVHSDGSLNFNGKLNGEIKSRQIEIRISDDGKRIVLIPDGKNNHKFTKSGRTKNTELIRTLKKKHIGVPATFEMERYMDSEIWIGEIIKIKKNKK